MKILFDNQIFYMQRFGGISRYFSEIIKGIKTKPGFEAVPPKFFSNNAHLVQSGLVSYKGLASVKFLHSGRVRNHIYKKQRDNASKALKEGLFDVFHPTYYDDSFLQFIGGEKPFVITVHDMIHELYYDKHSDAEHFESRNKKKLLPLASHIIAVSYNTRKDILKFFPEINPSKISVAYHGASLSSHISPKTLNLKLPPRYILFVGKRDTYKNFKWFIDSISKILRDQNIYVVCAGGGPLTLKEVAELQKNNIGDKVIYIEFKDDKDLVSIYSNATCFVYPSLYEGFGIPILEAFACNCPVILSNCSSFPEVGDNAALYFELNDSDGLANTVQCLFDDEGLRKKLILAGRERLKMFSWEASIKQHEAIYKTLLN